MSSAAIQFLQRSGLLLLHIPSTAQESDFSTIPDMLAEKLGYPGTPPLSGIVVDLKPTASLNESIWTAFAAQLAGIPGRNRFFAVNAPAAFSEFAQKGGVVLEVFGTVEDVFKMLSTRRAASRPLADGPKAKSTGDVEFEKLLSRAFQDATVKTFEVQCSTTFRAGDPYPKTQSTKLVYDIAASMGLMSKTVSGSVALGFKEDVFLTIMSKMLGETFTTITREVEDGCGELLNIIFGQAKKTLSNEGHQFGKTLPVIFIGQSLRVRQLTPFPGIILPFESKLGPVNLELGYRKI